MVRGVLQGDGNLIAGSAVKAFDLDDLGKNKLGETTTSKTDKYQIKYSESAFQCSKKECGGPELVVRAYSKEGAPLAQPKLKFNASREDVVNLAVGGEQPFTVSGTIHGSGNWLRAEMKSSFTSRRLPGSRRQPVGGLRDNMARKPYTIREYS
jgi:hypothetical protein